MFNKLGSIVSIQYLSFVLGYHSFIDRNYNTKMGATAPSPDCSLCACAYGGQLTVRTSPLRAPAQHSSLPLMTTVTTPELPALINTARCALIANDWPCPSVF